MVQLAFVYTENDAFNDEEMDLLTPVVGVAGFQIVPVLWDDPSISWGQYEAIFIRQAPKQMGANFPFGVWLQKALSSTPVFNSPELISWNADQSYLLDYQDKGVRTAEVAVVKSMEDFNQKISGFSAQKICVHVKSLQGSKSDPFTPGSEELSVAVKNSLSSTGSVILKEHFDDADIGSRVVFVVFNGRLSHAVLKGVGEVGDAAHSPSESLVLAADYAAKTSLDIWQEKNFSELAQMPLFGSIEIVLVNNEPVLLGVDFVNPDMYLKLHPYAIAKFFNSFLRQRNGFLNIDF